jgi:DNA repair exonuclease SbcCD ATPase subunit
LEKELDEQKLENFRLKNRLEELEDTDSSTAGDPERLQVVEMEAQVSKLEARISNKDNEQRIYDLTCSKNKMEGELISSQRERDELKMKLEKARRVEAEELEKINKLSEDYMAEYRKCTEAINAVELKKIEITHLKNEIENLKADLQKMETDFARQTEVKNEEIRQTQAKLKEKREQVKTICDELEEVRKISTETAIRAAEAKQLVLSKDKEIMQKKDEMKQKEMDLRKMTEDTKERELNLQTQLEELLTKTEENRPSKVKKLGSYPRRARTTRRKAPLKSWGHVRPLSEITLSKKDIERSEAEARVLIETVRPDGKRPSEVSVLKDEVILVVKLGSKASDEGIFCCFKKFWPLTTVVRAGLAV